MIRILCSAAAALAIVMTTAVATCDGESDSEAQPVLVELFTSEGCSSCPPADALLERLDRSQPIPGARVVVLSEHVDYWNHIGWVDPYSSRVFSARQERYAFRFRTEGPYTPQIVVDGRAELVGSDARSAESAIRDASRLPKVAIRIFQDGGSAHVEVDPLPKGMAAKAAVVAAYAADSGSQEVLRGENKGRRLHHVAIVRELKSLGSVDRNSPFRATLPLQNGSRLIVFVQEAGEGAVRGAAMVPAMP